MAKDSGLSRPLQEKFVELQRSVLRGEGVNLEFKKKASPPDKIIQEMIAFANSSGGTLLIGVADNGAIDGVKYPEEELFVVQEALQKYCQPLFECTYEIIPISEKKSVVAFTIPMSEGRPHFFHDGQKKWATVRSKDMCIKASAEMQEIIRRSKSTKGTKFTFGDHEKTLMSYLQEKNKITLDEFMKITGISHFQAARKLILLVLAHVLIITPTMKGDVYSRL